MMKIAVSIPDLHFRTKVLRNFNPLFTTARTLNSSSLSLSLFLSLSIIPSLVPRSFSAKPPFSCLLSTSIAEKERKKKEE